MYALKENLNVFMTKLYRFVFTTKSIDIKDEHDT